MIKNKIWVSFQKEGIHSYPRAGWDIDLYDVSFLQYSHRHLFHFKIAIEVFHDDRDIEFIQFKRWLEDLYDSKKLEIFGSCEMIANELLKKIIMTYRDRDVIIDVSEDNENGSTLEYTK